MRKLLMIAGLIAATVVPTSFAPVAAQAASANVRCERSKHNDRVVGTVGGGLAGALIGSQLAGRGSGTEGALLGGVVGAVAGNQIARSGHRPCPTGYVATNRRAVGSQCHYEDRSYRDAYGRRIARQVRVCR